MLLSWFGTLKWSSRRCQGAGWRELFVQLLIECVGHEWSLVSLFNEGANTQDCDAQDQLSLPPQMVKSPIREGWRRNEKQTKLVLLPFYFHCMTWSSLRALLAHLNELGPYQERYALSSYYNPATGLSITCQKMSPLLWWMRYWYESLPLLTQFSYDTSCIIGFVKTHQES